MATGFNYSASLAQAVAPLHQMAAQHREDAVDQRRRREALEDEDRRNANLRAMRREALEDEDRRNANLRKWRHEDRDEERKYSDSREDKSRKQKYRDILAVYGVYPPEETPITELIRLGELEREKAVEKNELKKLEQDADIRGIKFRGRPNITAAELRTAINSEDRLQKQYEEERREERQLKMIEAQADAYVKRMDASEQQKLERTYNQRGLIKAEGESTEAFLARANKEAAGRVTGLMGQADDIRRQIDDELLREQQRQEVLVEKTAAADPTFLSSLDEKIAQQIRTRGVNAVIGTVDPKTAALIRAGYEEAKLRVDREAIAASTPITTRGKITSLQSQLKRLEEGYSTLLRDPSFAGAASLLDFNSKPANSATEGRTGNYSLESANDFMKGLGKDGQPTPTPLPTPGTPPTTWNGVIPKLYRSSGADDVTGQVLSDVQTVASAVPAAGEDVLTGIGNIGRYLFTGSQPKPYVTPNLLSPSPPAQPSVNPFAQPPPISLEQASPPPYAPPAPGDIRFAPPMGSPTETFPPARQAPQGAGAAVQRRVAENYVAKTLGTADLGVMQKAKELFMSDTGTSGPQADAEVNSMLKAAFSGDERALQVARNYINRAMSISNPNPIAHPNQMLR